MTLSQTMKVSKEAWSMDKFGKNFKIKDLSIFNSFRDVLKSLSRL